MSCGSDQEVPFEGLRISLILQNGIMRYFSFNTLLEVNELMRTLIGFEIGVLLGLSPIAITIGEFGLLTGVFKPPLHKLFSSDEYEFFWTHKGVKIIIE